MTAKNYAIQDEHGRCDGILLLDEASAEHFRTTEPERRLLEVPVEQLEVLKVLPHAVRHDGEQWLLIDDDDLLEQWDRRAGLSNRAVMEAKQARQQGRAALTNAVLTFPKHTAVLQLPPGREWSRQFAFTPGALANGLAVAEADIHDVQRIAAAVRRSGFYPHTDAEDLVEGWHRDPNSWLLVFSWQGRVVQYEHICFEGDGCVRFGFTEHVMHERPYWFWRCLEQPVFDQLAAAGITEAYSLVRSDAVKYVEALKSAYAAEDGGQVAGRFTRLDYALQRTVDQPAVFPARRTAGAGWQWTSADGNTLVREAFDGAPARALIKASWKGNPRTAEILGMFDERVALDSATVLIGETSADGKNYIPAIVYVVRERSREVALFSTLMPYADALAQDAAVRGVMEWHRAVGYLKATTFFTQAQLDHPSGKLRVQQLGGAVGAKRKYAAGTWYELSVDIAETLARSEVI